jgi:hypothetical protein
MRAVKGHVGFILESGHAAARMACFAKGIPTQFHRLRRTSRINQYDKQYDF